MTPTPSVTVIALCYNHARFLVECLESIRSQSYRGFQLIVTDDHSTDDSAEIIAVWLERNWPEATFIRHDTNAGLCRTLNEALAAARGDFISMIATDDVWEPDKIERQLNCAARHSDDVAVVYSDATRMDVAGNRLDGDFIETAYPGCSPPSGRIFQSLANRNFIPAMATLVRKASILQVGGYDERLTFEDYDMWLRLSARWSFVFCPGLVARYRIVPSSLVRTLFGNPSADHRYTMFLIREKWLTSSLLTPRLRKTWKDEYFGSAYALYCLGDKRARRSLWAAALRTLKPRALVLAIACTLGLSRVRIKNWISALGIGPET